MMYVIFIYFIMCYQNYQVTSKVCIPRKMAGEKYTECLNRRLPDRQTCTYKIDNSNIAYRCF